MKKYLIYLFILVVGFALGAMLWPKESSTAESALHDHDHEEGTIYTCSMHPQIRQNEPGRCPLCGMDLTPVGAESAMDSDPVKFEMTANAVRLAGVQTEEVKLLENNSISLLSLNARLSTNKDQDFAQVAHIPGRVDRLYVGYEGQYIPAGAALAEVYSPPLIKAQEELRLARKMNEATASAAEEKLSQWRLRPEQIAKILASEEIISTFTIYADQGGTVNAKLINLGDYINPGQEIYRAVNLQSLWLEAEAYERDLSSLSLGQPLEFTLAGFPGESFKASIDYIDPFVDPSKRTFIVRATISNPGGRFKPEMLASVKVETTVKTSANGPSLSIPAEAILWTGQRSVVYVQDKDDASGLRFGLREVVLGEKIGSRYVVLEGLELGERVVSKGAFSLDAAAQLAGKASMMNSARAWMTSETNLVLPEWTDVRASSSDALKKQIFGLVEAYLELKDALVEALPAEAKLKAAQMESLREAIRVDQEPEQVRENWEKINALIQSLSMAISEENNLDIQRNHFIMLSNSMIALVSSIGFEGETLYLQNCPMANNDLGADWLSLEENIRNPYFGSLMMTCGTVEGVFEK